MGPVKSSIFGFIVLFPVLVFSLNDEIDCISSSNSNRNCTVPIGWSKESEKQANLKQISELYRNSNDNDRELFLSQSQILIVGDNVTFLGNRSIEKYCAIKNYDVYGWVPLKESKEYSVNGTVKGTNGNFSILTKLIPTRFEIHNVKFGEAENIMVSHKTPIASTMVRNIENIQKDLLVIIHYRFRERLTLNNKVFQNITSINEDFAPIRLEYEHNLVNLNATGFGNFLKMSEYNFPMKLPPKSQIFVQLIGQWEKREYNITADLLAFYGDTYFKCENVTTRISITTVVNPEPVFGEPVKLAENKTYSILPKKQTINHEFNSMESKNGKIGSVGVYPGFRPYFIIGCCLVGITSFLALGNMFRIIINEKKQKQKQSKNQSRF